MVKKPGTRARNGFWGILVAALFTTSLLAQTTNEAVAGGDRKAEMANLASQTSTSCFGGNSDQCSQLLHKTLTLAEKSGLGSDANFRNSLQTLLMYAPVAQTDPIGFRERALKIIGVHETPDQLSDFLCGGIGYYTATEYSTAAIGKLKALEGRYPICKQQFENQVERLTEAFSQAVLGVQASSSGNAESNSINTPSMPKKATTNASAATDQVPTLADTVTPDCWDRNANKCDQQLERVLQIAEAHRLGADANFRRSVGILLHVAPAVTSQPVQYRQRVLRIIGVDSPPDRFTDSICEEIFNLDRLWKTDAAGIKRVEEAEKAYPVCKQRWDQDQRRYFVPGSDASPGLADLINGNYAGAQATGAVPPKAIEQIKRARDLEAIAQEANGNLCTELEMMAKYANEHTSQTKMEHPEAGFLAIFCGNASQARAYAMQMPQEPSGDLALGYESSSQLGGEELNPTVNKAISMSGHYPLAVLLHLHAFPHDMDLAHKAFQLILSEKGRDLDLAAERIVLLRNANHSGTSSLERQLVAGYADASHMWAEAALHGVSIPQRDLSAMDNRLEALEDEWRDKYPIDASTLTRPQIEEVQRALGDNDVLVEYAAVWLPKFDIARTPHVPVEERWEDVHYVAYTLTHSGNVEGFDLGAVSEVDKAIAAYRSLMDCFDPQDLLSSTKQAERRKQVTAASQLLFQRLWKPLLPSMDGVRKAKGHIYVSPDGNLALVPFDGLIDEDRAYLISNWQLSYLTSGRQLALSRTESTHGKDVVGFADPTVMAIHKDFKSVSNPSSESSKSCTGAKANTFNTIYDSLPNSLLEGQMITDHFPSARVMTGDNASESNLKGIHSPRILHLATHGYYLDPPAVSVSTAANDDNRRPKYRFLRSGIILSEFGRQGLPQDGIVTSLEIALLDLNDTDLVVLSACDSGLGDTTPGDSITGMRAAFHFAGAKTVISTLWTVDDVKSEEIMRRLYARLARGETIDAAMREARREWIHEHPDSDPYFWSPYVVEGKDEICVSAGCSVK